MLTTLLLSSALAAGQVPAPVEQFIPVQAAGQPAPAPAPAPAPMTMPMPMPPMAGHAAPPMAGHAAPPMVGHAAPPMVAAPVAGPAPVYVDAPACEPATAEKMYALERLLEGSAAGQLLADRGIKVFGWAGMNYTYSTNRGTNLPVTFNDRPNNFQMNQAWFETVKAIDTSNKEVQIGFRSAGFYGTDYRFTQARGLFNEQLQRGENYGFDPVYAYGDLYLPNLGGEGTTVRVGRMPTICSYEVIDAVNTPFLTKSYTFQSNPFTHTGALVTTQVNECLSVFNGAVTGSDVFIDPAASLTYIGGVKYAPKDGNSTVQFNAVVGNNKFNTAESFAHYNCYNVVLTRKVTDKLTYAVDAMYSHMRNIPAVGTADWYGFANYFLYQVNDCLASNLRLEYFDDARGVRTGTQAKYYEATYGLTWTPADALVVRPFARYDYANGGRPFEGDRELFTGGVELIVRW